MAGSGRYLGRPARHWNELLSSPDPLARRLACHALGQCGALGEDVVATLRATAADDPEGYVRVWAAASLARHDPGDGTARSALLRECGDPADFVRSLAVWMLGRLDLPTADGEVDAVVRRLLDDSAPSVRAEAAIACDRLAADSSRQNR
ncbi:HEAT repeat domain-containing protein [Kitasatospora sp. NPDC048540]|uniref:HEAT repeat domain-containing protein n=1 Tax=unclassified Kitasatospora TaxID=2633591 RepID=UPI000539C07E|nr:HEAT repeat domain-containing protein [Kitasatospora sp. MBT63]